MEGAGAIIIILTLPAVALLIIFVSAMYLASCIFWMREYLFLFLRDNPKLLLLFDTTLTSLFIHELPYLMKFNDRKKTYHYSELPMYFPTQSHNGKPHRPSQVSVNPPFVLYKRS
ncbi:hypothetical protein B5X24_HaOG207266 [Helicoverpa armigera]|uniref:Uncharacterized protein n=1 Tax=Helicoverpa armigera TaxID=29058 RepID=A0A2W1BMD1_HELAM|nr:hypothetical protein B5X24_HaOG207266 [Helicoverpa armigera]